MSKTTISSTIVSSSTSMPLQMVSTTEKEKPAYIKGCLDFLDYQSAAQSAEKIADAKKYRILSGDFKPSDYSKANSPKSILTASTTAKDQAANPHVGRPGDMFEDIQHYPIMIRPINTIIGEYISRISQLHGFYAKNLSPKAKNEYNRIKTELTMEHAVNSVMKRVYAKLKQQGVDIESEEGQQAVQQNTPEDIQDYVDRDYKDISEQVCQTLLKHIWKEEGLDVEFVEGFKRACIVAKEFYHIYTVNGRTKVKNISDREVFYHKSPSVRWVSEGQYAGLRQYLTPSAVIDTFYDDLTVEHIQAIEDHVNPTYRKANQTASGKVSYDSKTFSNNSGRLVDPFQANSYDMISDFQLTGGNSFYSGNTGLVKVVRGYWKSYRQFGWLTTYDPNTDEPILEMVDENYKPKAELGEHVQKQVCNQVYTGAKILDNIYVDCGPYQDQIVDLEDLQYAPLPIEGCTYNDTDSKPYSLVDLMTPWNELYNIGAHELKEVINSHIGRVLFMSVDHLPNIPGFDMDKWRYWVKKFKIAWVKQPKTGPNTFNQFSSADMSGIAAIGEIMNMLERIKQECDSIAGFSPGRVAAQSQSQTLGESNQQLTASVNQTEYLFFRHSKLIERVLNQALNLAKNNLKDKTFIRNLFDDYELAFIDLEDADVANQKIGIYISNSHEDQRKRAAIQQLMQPAMQNGADFVDLAEIIMAETISETRNIGNKLRRASKAARQAEQEYKSKELEQKAASDKAILDQELVISRERNKANVESAYIKTFGGMNAGPEDDTDGDGVPDVMEFYKFDQKERGMMKDFSLKNRSQAFKEKQHSDDTKIREKELEAEKQRTAMMGRRQSSK